MSANVKINELPSGNFNAKVFDYTDEAGKRHYKSITAPSKRDVKRLIAEFLAQRETDKQSKTKLSVSEAICKYIESKNNILSPSTIRGYKIIKKNNLQGIMELDISKLTNEIIQAEINKEAVGHSPKTVRNIYGLLSASLSMFLPYTNFKIQLPQKEKKEIEIPSEEEMLLIFKAVKGKDKELPVYLAAYCGMRASEISALTWNNVNMKNKTMTIKEATVLDETGVYVTKGTKTTAGTRTIPIFTPLYKLLKSVKKKEGKLTEIKPQAFSKKFSALLEANGIKHYRFHDLRHYTVSVMLSLNIPKKYIADYVGHESERMIDAVYGHVMKGAKVNFMDIADRYFTENAT